MTTPRWPSAAAVAAVALGGVIGAVTRYGIGSRWPSPWAIVAVNVVGALLLGVLMGVLSRRPGSPLWRPFLGVGVLGGFTTFSTAMADALAQVRADHWWTAAALVLSATVGAVLAAGAGWRSVGRRSPPGRPGIDPR